MTRVLKIAGVLLLAASSSCGWTPDEEGPDQPIAFYHSVHAGQNQIPCMYCHYTADRSESAGIPSVKLCVGCHVPGSASAPPAQAQLAFPTAQRNKFWNAEATKLVDFWKRGEPIPWVRIHDLPEHVKFPHFMHVNAGLQCQTCHGPVEKMDKVYQFSSLQMGWCIDCHRGDLPLSDAEEAAVKSRSSYVKRIAALAASGSDVRGQREFAPNQRARTDCWVCHY
ncbi:MAG: cytochrome c family protein [Gemmatimonadota bacterium]|nr:cytochrome c family protein [Gemmatimonadota bacterium]